MEVKVFPAQMLFQNFASCSELKGIWPMPLRRGFSEGDGLGGWLDSGVG